MIKKLLNYELGLFIPYFLYGLVTMLILGFVMPLIASIPPLVNESSFSLYYNSSNIFSYLYKIYNLSLCIYILIFGCLIHLFIKKNIISPQGRNMLLLPIEKKNLFITCFSSISIWSFILLLSHVIISFMGLSIFALINIEYQNLYSLFLIEQIDFTYILNLLSYFFILETIIIFSIFSSFLSFSFHFKKFNYLFFFLFYIIVLLGTFGIIVLFLLPITDMNLRYIVLLLICWSVIILFTYFDIQLFDKRIETE
ncbi:MAG: hypothetical protein ACI4U5_01280 [Bacilli bacterium]